MEDKLLAALIEACKSECLCKGCEDEECKQNMCKVCDENDICQEVYQCDGIVK